MRTETMLVNGVEMVDTLYGTINSEDGLSDLIAL